MEAPFPEFIGWAAPQESSEIMPPQGPIFDADVLARTARVHEDAGFDRVLIGYFTNAPDGFIVVAHVAALDRAPRDAARPPARLRRPDARGPQDGDARPAEQGPPGRPHHQRRQRRGPGQGRRLTDHGARYRRSREYVEVLRRTWASREAFDHAGEFYKVEGALARSRRGTATPSRCTAAAVPTRRSTRWRR